jgi:hypothetical protein
LKIPRRDIESSIPVAFKAGWNLVGINGYSQSFTARSLIDSISSIQGLTANNVTYWPTSKGRYEGFQKSENTEYGFDFPIKENQGYFIRISNFEPVSANSKSTLWQEGGSLNGTSGGVD